MREAIQSKDLEKMKTAKDAALQASHKLTEEMYKTAGAGAQGGAEGQAGHSQQSHESASGNDGGQSGGSSGSGRNPDDVIDADFKSK